jgi:hypothetical protein
VAGGASPLGIGRRHVPVVAIGNQTWSQRKGKLSELTGKRQWFQTPSISDQAQRPTSIHSCALAGTSARSKGHSFLFQERAK